LQKDSVQVVNEEVPTTVDTVSNHVFLRNKSVLLSTAIVLIKNISNQFIECRVPLDAGSQSNFKSQHMAATLFLNLHKTNPTVAQWGEWPISLDKTRKVSVSL
jgi:hypothetical protein